MLCIINKKGFDMAIKNQKVLTELHLSTLRTAWAHLNSEYKNLMLDLEYEGFCHRTDKEIKNLRVAIDELKEALYTWG
tara:strand:- start:235 stop:468 length:234 start_codon:yes stop_codon:yes gene_type:complete